MGVYGYLWVIMGIYKFYGCLWVSGYLWATMSIYMGEYWYMIVYECLWVFITVYWCQ